MDMFLMLRHEFRCFFNPVWLWFRLGPLEFLIEGLTPEKGSRVVNIGRIHNFDFH
jgi:hypothetical protein